SPGSGWNVAAVGDLYGAGDSDLVLQNTSGQIYVLEMSGTAGVGGGNVGNYGAAWNVAEVGDFYGNGTSDIALQNTTTGQIFLLEASGSNVIGGGSAGNPGAT